MAPTFRNTNILQKRNRENLRSRRSGCRIMNRKAKPVLKLTNFIMYIIVEQRVPTQPAPVTSIAISQLIQRLQISSTSNAPITTSTLIITTKKWECKNLLVRLGSVQSAGAKLECIRQIQHKMGQTGIRLR